MTWTRTAYMPLATYPEAIADESIRAATVFAGALGCALEATTFEVDLPRVSSGLADFLIDLPAVVRANEERSKAECQRLEGVVRGAWPSQAPLQCAKRRTAWTDVPDVAANEARYSDLSLLPWSGETVAAQDLIQAVVFGSGRPAILVPAAARAVALDHIAIAWDASRVAARALGDALPLLAEGGLISVLTVRDEKPLGGLDVAADLASALIKRGFNAGPLETTLGKRTVAEALQDTALSRGAQLLVMGGFGHSRVRDFVLGGATKGILNQLRLPVLLSH